jgi:hypothetical protein
MSRHFATGERMLLHWSGHSIITHAVREHDAVCTGAYTASACLVGTEGNCLVLGSPHYAAFKSVAQALAPISVWICSDACFILDLQWATCTPTQGLLALPLLPFF